MFVHPLLRSLAGGLIVSCQALPDEPLFGAEHMAAMARAASQGGAVGIRANSPVDIAAIRKAVTLPVIGLYKQKIASCEVYITPTFEAAREVSLAGAHIIALDATLRPHPAGKTAAAIISEIHTQLKKPVLADIDTLEAGLAAQAAGAEAVSTTLSGYTRSSSNLEGPDFDLIENLVRELTVPVFAEGRFWNRNEVKRALDLGAFAVVVGAAITRPQLITRSFVEAIQPNGGARNR
jgi:N-acylglucosamine-6-phosphate 2-epimerase